MKGRWLAPGELKHLYQQDKLQGIYIPYWTFDADADVNYRAEGGRDRQVTRKDKDGKTYTEVVTDWYPVAGHVNHFFDDVLIHASNHLDESLIEGIEPFNTMDIPAYSPDYLSGYSSEIYTVDLKDAHLAARTRMSAALYSMVEQDVLRRYDHVRSIRMDEHYDAETYKHVLLPVYSTAYRYKNKTYTVLINGQTGRVKGEYPKSVAKITLIILLVLAIIGMFFLATSGGEEDYGLQKNETETVCEYEADELTPAEYIWIQEVS